MLQVLIMFALQLVNCKMVAIEKQNDLKQPMTIKNDKLACSGKVYLKFCSPKTHSDSNKATGNFFLLKTGAEINRS